MTTQKINILLILSLLCLGSASHKFQVNDCLIYQELEPLERWEQNPEPVFIIAEVGEYSYRVFYITRSAVSDFPVKIRFSSEDLFRKVSCKGVKIK